MKKLEILSCILKEKPDEDVYTLFNEDDIYLLSYLCTLNRKYLNKKNLNYIINHAKKSNFITKNTKYSNISYLISKFPDLIDKISSDIINKLDMYNQVNILRNQPKLINKYKEFYKKKENTLFAFILDSKEDLNVNFNYTTVYDLTKDINEFDISGWLNILRNNPNLIKMCPIVNEINKSYNKYPRHVIELVSNQIQFKYLLPSIDKIDDDYLSMLISNQPQLIDELNIDLKKLYTYNWPNILSKQPQLINECNKLDELTIESWTLILRKQPKLIKYCNKINKLNCSNWRDILTDQPELADKCNKFDEFDSLDWCILLEIQPQFIYKCKDTNIINEKHKINLLRSQPGLIDKIPFDKINDDCIKILYNSREHHLKFIKSYIKNNKNPEVLTDMIGLYPDLKYLYSEYNLWKYIDFSQLTNNLEYRIFT